MKRLIGWTLIGVGSLAAIYAATWLNAARRETEGEI